MSKSIPIVETTLPPSSLSKVGRKRISRSRSECKDQRISKSPRRTRSTSKLSNTKSEDTSADLSASLSVDSTLQLSNTEDSDSREDIVPLSQGLLDALNLFDEVMMEVNTLLNEDVPQMANLANFLHNILTGQMKPTLQEQMRFLWIIKQFSPFLFLFEKAEFERKDELQVCGAGYDPDVLCLTLNKKPGRKDVRQEKPTAFRPPNNIFDPSEEIPTAFLKIHSPRKRRQRDLSAGIAELKVDHPGVKYDESNVVVEVTMAGLTECLLHMDRAFIDTVLGLHDTFVTAQDLLSNLTVAYHLARRENDTVTQQKVVDVVKSWTSTSRIDFRTNPLFLADFQAFVIELEESQEPLEVKWAASISAVHERAEEEAQNAEDLLMKVSAQVAPPNNLPKKLIEGLSHFPPKLSLFDFPPMELAKQIALYNYDCFRKIPLHEFVCKRFEKPHLSPRLAEYSIVYSNLIDTFGSEIFKQTSYKRRSKKLKELQDYSGMAAILSSVTHYTVERLQKTWKSVPANDIAKLQQLKSFNSPLGNFKQLRSCLEKDVPPLVPVLAMFLRDLTFIEDGNSTWNDKKKTKINMEKIALLGRVLGRLQLMKSIPFKLIRIPQMQEWLAGYIPTSLHEREAISKKLKQEELDIVSNS